MSHGLLGHPFMANGTIETSRFVKLDTTAGKLFHVIQADANNGLMIGISQEGSADVPGLTGSADDAARAGMSLRVYGPGDVCLLEAGTGGWTAGDWLEADANGKGVTIAATAATKRNVGAKALETVVAGEKGRVVVSLGVVTNPA